MIARLFKVVMVLLIGAVGILAVAAVSLYLFFDPNDFRDRISAEVKEATGRDLTIEGDLSLSVFPWLAVETGRIELGNADGFGSDPFLTFEQASLSVRLLPLIFRQEIAVGTASVDGLVVNLEVARNGRTNWDDLVEASEEDAGDSAGDGGPSALDVASISVRNADVSYTDRGAGSRYEIANLNFETGRIKAGSPVALRGNFDFDVDDGALGGYLALRATAEMSEGAEQVTVSGLNLSGVLTGIVENQTEINFDSRELVVDTVAQTIDAGEMDLTVLGLSMSADVEPFSYAGDIRPTAALRVAQFSLKDLLTTLDIEPPVTANPDALQRVELNATASLGATHLTLNELALDLDRSQMTGMLAIPVADDAALRFELDVDEIVLDDYMAPADDSAGGASSSDDDVEIPVDLIRTLEANGKLSIRRASLTGLQFEFAELGLQASGGKLRLNPLAAQLYAGTYSGDVRIDASRDRASVSVNEKIAGVSLRPLAQAMFEKDNITGSINGGFVLSGSGNTLAAIRQDLDGNMNFELVDGAWEGVDVWHQLRAARALLRGQPVPQPRTPVRTQFSNVKASGTVTDGIFENNDFRAELPFLQLTGSGSVDLVQAQVNYGLRVRVLEKPELMGNVSDAELADFTETVIPLKITGALAAPKIQPDVEAILRQELEQKIDEKKEEVRDRILDRLLGGEQAPPAEGEPPAEETPQEEESLEEQLKKKLLKDLIGN